MYDLASGTNKGFHGKKYLTDKLIRNFGRTYSEQLGIDLESRREKEVFKWFLASILFGKRISENIAIKTYQEFEKRGLITLDKILEAGWDRLVDALDAGGYVRYDFSTADKLLELMKVLRKYGDLNNIHKEAKNEKDLEEKLKRFKGVGPVTVNIFLRELRCIWEKANPEPSRFTKIGAKNLGIDINRFKRNTKDFVALECALLRVGKNYCLKKKCKECHFSQDCKISQR